MERAGVFAIKMQLIWATYVLFVFLYFVSVTRNVRPVGEWILSPICTIPIFHALFMITHNVDYF